MGKRAATVLFFDLPLFWLGWQVLDALKGMIL